MIIFIMLIISLYSSDNTIYNCVDCTYDNTKNFDDINVLPLISSNIVYEQPLNTQILIQNYSCPKCGLFEVSIRKNLLKTMKK
jgi:hypothetical protein